VKRGIVKGDGTRKKPPARCVIRTQAMPLALDPYRLSVPDFEVGIARAAEPGEAFLRRSQRDAAPAVARIPRLRHRWGRPHPRRRPFRGNDEALILVPESLKPLQMLEPLFNAPACHHATAPICIPP
jgi:hypothetical protein